MEDLQPGDILIANIKYKSSGLYLFYKKDEPYTFIGHDGLEYFRVIDNTGDTRMVHKVYLMRLAVKDPINSLKEIISNILDK